MGLRVEAVVGGGGPEDPVRLECYVRDHRRPRSAANKGANSNMINSEKEQ